MISPILNLQCQLITKELCIYLKAIAEWNLSSRKMEHRMEDFLLKLLAVYGWISSDILLLSAFISFLQKYNSLNIAKICLTKQHNGISIMRGIVKKAQDISSKTPHTDTNLALLRNILEMLVSYSSAVDVRLLMKSLKIFEMLDILHPQLQKNRKTTWNEVTIYWLKFFEKLSMLEDTDCNPK